MRKTIPVVMVVCVLAAVGIFLWQGRAPNRTILRNSSGAEIANVRLFVENLDGTATLSKEAGQLGVGESLVLRHGLNDSRVKVFFRLAGKDYEHTEGYVDLWRGEGWVFDVMPSGAVRSGYQSVMEK